MTKKVFFSYFSTLLLVEKHSFDDRWMNKGMNMNDCFIVTNRTKLKFSEENLSQCHLIYHKSRMDRPHGKPGHLLSKINKKVPLSKLIFYDVWRHLL
jgi:hypothetical protein